MDPKIKLKCFIICGPDPARQGLVITGGGSPSQPQSFVYNGLNKVNNYFFLLDFNNQCYRNGPQSPPLVRMRTNFNISVRIWSALLLKSLDFL